MKAYLLAAAHAEATTQPSRMVKAFFDPLTHFFNKTGFDLVHAGEGSLVAAVTTTDLKAINDQLSHTQADELLKALADLVAQSDPRAARVGTNFVFRIESQAALEQLLEAWGQTLPQCLELRGGTGSSSSLALANMEDRIDAGRAKGRLADQDAGRIDPETRQPIVPAFDDDVLLAEFPDAKPLPSLRGQTALDLERLRAPEAFGPHDRAQRSIRIEPRLVARLAHLGDPRRFAFEQHFDQKLNGDIMNRAGWDAAGERAWVLAVDGIGIRAINQKFYELARTKLSLGRAEAQAFGRSVGDRALQVIAKVARELGGHGVHFSRLSGDEFGGKHDDVEELLQYGADLQAELAARGPIVVDLGNGERIEVPVGIRLGIGENNYAQADHDLRARRAGAFEGTSGLTFPPAGTGVERAKSAERRGIFDLSRFLRGEDAGQVRTDGEGPLRSRRRLCGPRIRFESGLWRIRPGSGLHANVSAD